MANLRDRYSIEMLTPEQREQYRKDIDTYLKYYPELREPVMMDLLHEYELMRLRLQMVETKIMSGEIEPKQVIKTEKLADMLRRTISLYANRMGISYVSKQRRKEQIKRKPPTEES